MRDEKCLRQKASKLYSQAVAAMREISLVTGKAHRKLFGALNDLIKFYLRHWQLENLISSQNTKLTNDKMLRSRKYQNNVCHVTVEWIRREAKKINKAKSDEKLLLAF